MTTTADGPQPDDSGAPESDFPPPPVVTEDPATSFTRQRATRWLEPRLLLQTGLQVVVSAVLGEYNDKRELMGEIAADGYLDLSTSDGDLWIDYVSDLGDGFDATYSVAALLSRSELDVAPPDRPAADHGRRPVLPGRAHRPVREPAARPVPGRAPAAAGRRAAPSAGRARQPRLV